MVATMQLRPRFALFASALLLLTLALVAPASAQTPTPASRDAVEAVTAALTRLGQPWTDQRMSPEAGIIKEGGYLESHGEGGANLVGYLRVYAPMVRGIIPRPGNIHNFDFWAWAGSGKVGESLAITVYSGVPEKDLDVGFDELVREYGYTKTTHRGLKAAELSADWKAPTNVDTGVGVAEIGDTWASVRGLIVQAGGYFLWVQKEVGCEPGLFGPDGKLDPKACPEAKTAGAVPTQEVDAILEEAMRRGLIAPGIAIEGLQVPAPVPAAGLKVDFRWEPAHPRPGAAIQFIDSTTYPSGGGYTQTWYFDGEPQGTGNSFSRGFPTDGKPHKVKLAVDNRNASPVFLPVQGENEQTVEALKIVGRVKASGVSGIALPAGVKVYAQLPSIPGDSVAVADAEGKFEFPWPTSDDKPVTVRFTKLSLPAGSQSGPSGWLRLGVDEYPLQLASTLDPDAPQTVEIEVPTATLRLRARVVSDDPNDTPRQVLASVRSGDSTTPALFSASLGGDSAAPMRVLAARGGNLDGVKPARQPAIALGSMPLHVKANFDSAVLDQWYEVSAPGAGQEREQELIVYTPAQIERDVRNRVKLAVRAMLGADTGSNSFAQADRVADDILNHRIAANAGVTGAQYNQSKGVIELPTDLPQALADPEKRETFYHEVFHAIEDRVSSGTLLRRGELSLGLGGSHDLTAPARTDFLAFDEGRSHFLAYLMLAADQNDRPKMANALYPADPMPVYDSTEYAALPRKHGVDGGMIEGTVTSFLLDFYGDAAVKDPMAVLKDFHETSNVYQTRRQSSNPAATVQEFIAAKKMGGTKPYNLDMIDQLVATYGIAIGSSPVGALTSEQISALKRSDGVTVLRNVPGETVLQAPPGSSGGTVTLPPPDGKNAAGTVILSPGTAAAVNGSGVSMLRFDPSRRQDVYVDTGDNSGLSVRYGSISAVPQNTRFAASVDTSGVFTLQVIAGKVRLSDTRTGKSVDVAAGQQAKALPGAPPSSPVAIADSPEARWWERVPGFSQPGPDLEWTWWLAGAAIGAGLVLVVRRARRRPRGPLATIAGPAHQARYCSACGQPLRGGARFCSACGAAVTGASDGSVP